MIAFVRLKCARENFKVEHENREREREGKTFAGFGNKQNTISKAGLVKPHEGTTRHTENFSRYLNAL